MSNSTTLVFVMYCVSRFVIALFLLKIAVHKIVLVFRRKTQTSDTNVMYTNLFNY